MEGRAGEVRTAGESIVVYKRWRRSKDDELLRQIAEYNKDDCHSTMLLRDWLLTLRPEGTAWFDPDSRLPNEEKVRERQEAVARRAGYERALLEGFAGEEQRLRELVCHLLEFHRREAKPGWWATLDRRDSSEEERIEDPECLGGMILDRSKPALAVARSKVFTYRFPPQECKLGLGDDVLCADTLERFGTVYQLDDSQCVVQIKHSDSMGNPPSATSIIPAGPIQSKVLKDAIARFAGPMVSDDGCCRAIRSLLARQLPRVRGVHGSATLVDPARGIFLPTTWRMHDDVCRFISEAVYDGRLKPENQNRHQVLVLSQNALPVAEEISLPRGRPAAGLCLPGRDARLARIAPGDRAGRDRNPPMPGSGNGA